MPSSSLSLLVLLQFTRCSLRRSEDALNACLDQHRHVQSTVEAAQPAHPDSPSHSASSVPTGDGRETHLHGSSSTACPPAVPLKLIL